MDKFWEIQDIIYEIQKNKHEKIVVSKCYRKEKKRCVSKYFDESLQLFSVKNIFYRKCTADGCYK